MSFMCVPVLEDHINIIASSMKEDDKKECLILGETPENALRRSIKASWEVKTLLHKGKPIMIYGIGKQNDVCGDISKGMISGEEVSKKIFPGEMLSEEKDSGIPWALGVPFVFSYRDVGIFMRMAQGQIRRWQKRSFVLHNYVGCHHQTALKWLSKLGFNIGKKGERELSPFFYFWM